MADETKTKSGIAELKMPGVAPQARPLAERVRDRLPETNRLPGEQSSGREAQMRLAGMAVPADVQQAIQQAIAGIPDAVDELTDHQAAALRARRLGRQGPARVGLGNPPPPNTLPAVQGRGVFARNPDFEAEHQLVTPRWDKVYDLPNWLQTPIRALGRTLFRGFDCFAAQERDAERRGEDPLGDIDVLAHIENLGPHPRRELDAAAGWIRANGVVVEANVLEFPGVFPGYRPRILLAMTETRSFLLVEERLQTGAKVNADYIYSWTGGRGYYLAGPHDQARLVRLVGGQAAVQRLLPARVPPDADEPIVQPAP